MAANGFFLLWLASTLVTSGEAVTEGEWVMDLRNRSLQSIPSDYSQNITKLILSDNLIKMADEQALKKYTRLTELDLHGNLLTHLPGKIFESLPELKVLQLSNNNISIVEPRAFSGLGNLEVLNLSYNLLQFLPLGVFDGLHNMSVDLADNPWNCSCLFVNEIKRINASRVRVADSAALCASPEDQAGKSIQNSGAMCSSGSPSSTEPPASTQPSSVQTITHSVQATPQTGTLPTFSNKDQAPGGSSGTLVGGNSWKFLVGVVAMALSTSMLIVCAVKSPSWYKLLFNYRHQRLREEDEPTAFTTGRFSNFSLDTEQTETSAHELDIGLGEGLDDNEEEEDGYIEDRYIETGDYKDTEEP